MANFGSFTITTQRSNGPFSSRDGVTADPSYDPRGSISSQIPAHDAAKLFLDSNGQDPVTHLNITEWYYEINTQKVVLRVQGGRANRGWNSIICEHNRMVFHRKDAVYQKNLGDTAWTWNIVNDVVNTPNAAQEARDAFRISPQYTTNTFSSGRSLTFTIVDEIVSSILPTKIVSYNNHPEPFYFEDKYVTTPSDLKTFWKHTFAAFTGEDAYKTDDLGMYANRVDVFWGGIGRVQYFVNATLGDVPTIVEGNIGPTAENPSNIGSFWTRGTLEATDSYTQGDVLISERLYSVSGVDTQFEGGLGVVNTPLPTLIAEQGVGLNFELTAVSGGLQAVKRESLNSGNSKFITKNTPRMGPSLISATNCRAMFNVENAFDITDTTFSVQGPIFEGDIHTSTEEGFITGTQAHANNLIGKKVRSYDGTFRATITDAEYIASTSQQISVLDIDNNGVIDALTDSLLILRYLFNLSGSSLVDSAVASNAERTTAAEIEAYIIALQQPANFITTEYGTFSVLDIDQNGQIDALTDGLLFMRYVFNLTGNNLADSALASNSPLDATTVTAHMGFLEELPAQVDINNTLISIGGSNNAAIGPGVNKTVITYTVDDSSIRSKPVPLPIGYRRAVEPNLEAEEAHLYIELPEGTQHVPNYKSIEDSIARDPYIDSSRTSTFRLYNWKGGRAFLAITNVAPVLLEPIDKGRYGASFSAYINGKDTSPAEFTPTICHTSGFSAGLPQFTYTPTPQHIVLTENHVNQDLGIISPDGDYIRVTVQRVPGYDYGQVRVYDDNLDNCTVKRAKSNQNFKAVQGKMDFIIFPGTPGKRFSATFRADYINQANDDLTLLHTVTGKIADPVRTSVLPYGSKTWDPVGSLSSTENLTTSSISISTSTKGSNAISLVFQLPEADSIQSAALKGKGYWASTNLLTKLHIDGGTGTNCIIENRVNPLTLYRTEGQPLEADIARRYTGSYKVEGPLIIPTTEGNLSCSGFLRVKVPSQTRASSSTIPSRVVDYPFSFNATWSPEFGFEILNDKGGTRLNISSQPFRITSQNAATMGTAAPTLRGDLSDVVQSEVKFSIEDGYYYKHSYKYQSQRDGTPFNQPLFNNLIEIYWDGERVERVTVEGNVTKAAGRPPQIYMDQTYYDPFEEPGRDGNFRLQYHKIGSQTQPGSDNLTDGMSHGQVGVDYYAVQKRINVYVWEQIFTTNTSFDLHTVPYATFENPETAEFLVLNNSPHSRSKTFYSDVDNTRIITRGAEWSINPATGHVFWGKMWENVTDNYAKIVIRID